MAEVFWSPITAMHCNKPPGTIVCGVPGGGKSFFLLNTAANCLEQGCNVFVLDAKNDMLPLKNLFPHIKTTDVNNISAGSLDPFLVFDDIESTTVLTIIEILCGKLTSEQKLAVTPIIGDFVNKIKLSEDKSSVTFRSFADYLYQNENIHAQSIGNQLILASQSKYGRLMFGDIGKKSVGITIGSESRIISILGMSLPVGKSEPKADETVNLAIVYIICRMIKSMLTNKTKNGKRIDKTPSVLILDECHMLMRSQAIADIIDEFLVLGRSLGVAVMLASQNVTHFPLSIAQLLSTKICFKMSKSEAQEFFDMFDNTTAERSLDIRDTMETVTRLKTGYAFMVDSNERCAILHITSNYDHGDITSNPLLKK